MTRVDAPFGHRRLTVIASIGCKWSDNSSHACRAGGLRGSEPGVEPEGLFAAGLRASKFEAVRVQTRGRPRVLRTQTRLAGLDDYCVMHPISLPGQLLWLP